MSRLRRLYKPAVLVSCRRPCHVSWRKDCSSGTTYWSIPSSYYGGRTLVAVLCCRHADDYASVGMTELSGAAEFEAMKVVAEVMES